MSEFHDKYCVSTARAGFETVHVMQGRLICRELEFGNSRCVRNESGGARILRGAIGK